MCCDCGQRVSLRGMIVARVFGIIVMELRFFFLFAKKSLTITATITLSRRVARRLKPGVGLRVYDATQPSRTNPFATGSDPNLVILPSHLMDRK